MPLLTTSGIKSKRRLGQHRKYATKVQLWKLQHKLCVYEATWSCVQQKKHKRISTWFEIKYNTYLIVYYKMPDLCQTSVSSVNKKKLICNFFVTWSFNLVLYVYVSSLQATKSQVLILLDDGSSYSFMSIMIFFFLQNLSKCTRQSACSRIGRHISILRSTYNRIVS